MIINHECAARGLHLHGSLQIHSKQGHLQHTETWNYNKSRSFAGEFSTHQREIINTQMKLVEPIASKHCKYDSPKTTTFNTMDFADEVKQECPLLYQILHTMVIRQNTHKSTQETPEKRIRLACLLLNFINYVRYRTNNTVPLFISLALASRGISSYQHDLLHSLRVVVIVLPFGDTFSRTLINELLTPKWNHQITLGVFTTISTTDTTSKRNKSSMRRVSTPPI